MEGISIMWCCEYGINRCFEQLILPSRSILKMGVEGPSYDCMVNSTSCQNKANDLKLPEMANC